MRYAPSHPSHYGAEQAWDAEEDPGLFCLNLEGWACLTVGLSATSKAKTLATI